MKTLVFSDTHLTDKFDPELFDYIAELVESADQVVINGDFWDGYLTTFDAFCNSQWNKLFPLLKNKHTVYIFGNHDKEEYMDERHTLFSDLVTLKHEFQSGDKKFVVEHGHLLAPSHDARFLFKNNKFVRPFYRVGMGIIDRNIIVRRIQHASDYYQGLGKLNSYITAVSQNFQKDTYYIFGHSHVHKMVSEFNVINTGVLQKKRRHYLLIDDSVFQLIPDKQEYE